MHSIWLQNQVDRRRSDVGHALTSTDPGRLKPVGQRFAVA
jgi:hypothetical protein